ncbi:MAG: COG3014 family protein [Acidiferrobacterales bacterium]
MLLRMQGEFAASNHTFELAKQRMHKLYGVSVSEQIGSVIINDGRRQYVGEEFEQVLLHVYMALNYLEMNEPDAARVEALQVNLKLRQFDKKIHKQKYTEDAFARYLSGLIYEAHGEWSDAMIEYRRAYRAYREYRKYYSLDMPQTLQHALVTMSDWLGLEAERSRYQQEFGIDDWRSADELYSHGELVFVLHNGLAPVKREDSVILPTPGTHTLVKVALPFYQSRTSPAKGARLRVDGEVVPMDLVEDVNAIAIRNLEVKMPAIQARALSRAGIKGAVAHALKQNDQWLLGLIVELSGLATEHADTRSWITLPHNIYLARVPLVPGSYTVRLELLDRYDSVLEEHIFHDVVITAAQKTFLSHHWVVPTHLLFEGYR